MGAIREYDFCLEHVCQAIAAGATWRAVAAAYHCDPGTVYAWFFRKTDPVYKAKWNARVSAASSKYHRRHYRADSEQAQRWRVRRMARKEAAETGEPVEAIYRRWGVA